MNKKVISLILLAAMLLTLTACGKKNSSAENPAPVASSAPISDSSSENNQPDSAPENSAENSSTGEAAKPETPERGFTPIPEENVSLGVVEGEGGGDIDDESEQQPQQPAQPTVTAPPASSEPVDINIRTLDYEGYQALSGEHQQQVIDMFGTTDEFMRWYKDVEAEYKEANPGVEIGGDGVVDAGSLVG